MALSIDELELVQKKFRRFYTFKLGLRWNENSCDSFMNICKIRTLTLLDVLLIYVLYAVYVKVF